MTTVRYRGGKGAEKDIWGSKDDKSKLKAAMPWGVAGKVKKQTKLRE